MHTEENLCMKHYSGIWDITPETAHSRARSNVPTDSVDFRSASPYGSVEDFIREEPASLGVADEDWDLLEEYGLQGALNADKGAALLARDDFIIGLAFSQLLTE